MRKVVDFFITRPIWANAILIVVLLFGLVAVLTMSSSFFPELDPTRITVSVFYPGASPEEMEEGVTVKVEESLKGIAGIEETSSSSQENYAVVTIKTYQNYDLDEVGTEVKNAIDGISSWPAGAEKPVVIVQKTNGMAAMVAFVSLSGDVDRFTLKEAAEDVEDDLLKSGKISQVNITGYPVTEFSIEVRESDLLRYNLTFDDVATAVRTNNQDISAGTIKTNTEELLIRSRARSTEIEKLSDIIIRSTSEGEILRVGDVANVKFQFADTPNESFLNGKRNVVFTVTKLPSEDLGSISDFVTDYAEKYNEKHENLEMTVMFDFNTMLNERIKLLLNNGFVGLILVLITLGLFLNLRLSFWVAVGIPFSFMAMFLVGTFYGMTVNMISLFGMILVVGILVDDGIVIAENIYSHYEKGKPPHKAALDGTMEVLPAVFTSILTTVVAFSVLLFVEGMEMMSEMAFVVIAALLFSLLEAFFVLPSHLSSKHIVKNKKKRKFSFRAYTDRFIAYMRDDLYSGMLKWVIKNRTLAFFIPLIFILVVRYLVNSGIIQTTIFPDMPFDDVKIEVAFTPGEREDKTLAFLNYCEEKVQEIAAELEEKTGEKHITYTSVSVGATEGLGESGANTGMVRVNVDLEDKEISSFDLVDMIRERIGEVKDAEKFTIGGEMRWGKPVSISLRGKNFRQIKEAKEYLKDELAAMSSLKDVTDNAGLGKREIHLKLKPEAYMLGMNHGEISRQIRQGFFGDEVQRLIVGTDEVRVWVRYPEEDRSSLHQLETMKIRTPGGQQYPLKQIVDYSVERGEVNIRHFDGSREITVDANKAVAFSSTTEIIDDIKSDVIPTLEAKFPDVNVEFMGQSRRGQKSMTSMLIGVVAAIFLMILIIALNFNSLLQSFIIIGMIPVGIYGGILGHGIEGFPVSMLSAWGFIALMGILVNDAVVYLDTFNRNLKESYDIDDAMYRAGIQRFRPIILTSITTVAGLYPIIFENSFQAKFLVPMAISVAYGVLFGTFFILLFLPAFVLTINDIKRNLIWLWTGNRPSRVEIESTIVDINRLKEIDSIEEEVQEIESI